MDYHKKREIDKYDGNERKGVYAFTAEELATPEKAKKTIKSFIEENVASLIGN